MLKARPTKKKTLNGQQKCNGNGQKLTPLACKVCVIALQTMSPCGHTPPPLPLLSSRLSRGSLSLFPNIRGDYGSIGQSDLTSLTKSSAYIRVQNPCRITKLFLYEMS